MQPVSLHEMRLKFVPSFDSAIALGDINTVDNIRMVSRTDEVTWYTMHEDVTRDRYDGQGRDANMKKKFINTERVEVPRESIRYYTISREHGSPREHMHYMPFSSKHVFKHDENEVDRILDMIGEKDWDGVISSCMGDWRGLGVEHAASRVRLPECLMFRMTYVTKARLQFMMHIRLKHQHDRVLINLLEDKDELKQHECMLNLHVTDPVQLHTILMNVSIDFRQLMYGNMLTNLAVLPELQTVWNVQHQELVRVRGMMMITLTIMPDGGVAFLACRKAESPLRPDKMTREEYHVGCEMEKQNMFEPFWQSWKLPEFNHAYRLGGGNLDDDPWHHMKKNFARQTGSAILGDSSYWSRRYDGNMSEIQGNQQWYLFGPMDEESGNMLVANLISYKQAVMCGEDSSWSDGGMMMPDNQSEARLFRLSNPVIDVEGRAVKVQRLFGFRSGQSRRTYARVITEIF